jgi:uncharacterized phage protein (TIGR01671 family)
MTIKENKMREIKFRAWESARGGMIWNRMFEVESIGWKRGKIISIEGHSKKEGACSWYQEDDCDITLMQFTGLHDKNGREIYESDICKLQGLRKYGVVCFEKGYFFFKAGTIAAPMSIEIWGPTAEVIGNIYKNPGLLEK